MSTTYVYALGVDLPAQVDIGALHESISTAFLANNSYITLSGTSLTVKFTTTLSGGEESTLANIISQYNYSAPIVREYFEYPIQILDTTNSTSNGSTGALMVNGGAFITKDLYAANLYMGTDRVATESYVSGNALTFGTGLTKTGNTVTVNSSLTHVTSVGTLTSLTVSGIAIAQSTPTLSTHIVNKGYVDALSYLTAGTGLTLTSGTLSVNASQTQITTIGTLTGLTISGSLSGSTATFSGTVSGATPTLSGNLTTKAYVDSLGYLIAGTGLTLTGSTLSVNPSQTQITTVGTLGSLSVTGTATFSSTVTVPTPVNTTDATNKSYVDTLGYLTAGTGLTKSGSTLGVNTSQTQITTVGTLTGLTISGSLSGTTATFSSTVTVPTPVNGTDATNKTYVDTLGYLTAGTGLTKTSSTLSVNASQTQITTVGTLTGLTISGSLNGSIASFTGNVSIPTAPSLGSHAVNKDYVDSVASGISAKASVVAASISGVTLSSLIVGSLLDGVTLSAGNRVLLKNQTTATENGIYVIQSSGAPVRSSDFATGADISGTFVFVEGGSTIASSGWVTTNTSGNDIVGTNAINWVQFSGTGQINAGNGLSKIGNTIDVNVDNTSLEIFADTLRISTGALGTGLSGGSGTAVSVNASQPQITTVGTLTSLTVSGSLSGSTATFSGVVIGATPTLSTHLTTKAYVDGITYLTAGTGLTKTSSTLSVNASQTQITAVGTLTSLTVSGSTQLTANIASTTTSTGTLVVTGGIGVSGQVTATTLSGTLQTAAQPNITSLGTLTSLTISGALSGSTASFTGTVTGATPTLSTHLTTKAYVDAISYITAGTGLTKTGSTLSVNASQTQITSIGTLTSLTVSGATTLTAGTASTTTGTGTLIVTGGIGVSGQVTATTLSGTIQTASQPNITSLGTLSSLTISGALSGSTATFSGTVSGATPTLSGHLTTKAYVDGLTYLVAGTGLTLTSGTLSVNTSQPQITAVGTLSTLAVSGSATFSSTVTVPTPVNSTDATNKTYVDSIGYLTAGTGLTKTASTLSVNASQTQITTVGTLTSLTLSGALTGTSASFTGNVSIPTAPTLGSHAANKDYVDSVASGISAKYSVVAATTGPVTLSTVIAGSSLDSVTLSAGKRVLLKNQTSGIENGIYVVQPSGVPVRSSDFTTGADISGTFVFVEGGSVNASTGWLTTNTSGSDIVGTNAINWVQFSGAGQITAGNGLSKTGNTLDVNVDNSSLEIVADTLRISTGALGTGLSGGSGTAISVNASQPQITTVGTLTGLTLSGSLSGTTATFSGVVIGATPTLSTHLTTKAYVDALSYLTAGTGLTLTGSTLSVNASQTQITTVGTLGSLTVTGTLSGSTASFSGTVIGATPTLSTHLTTKAYVDAISYLTAGTGLTKTGSTLSVTASQPQITSVGTLTSLTLSGALSGTSATFSGAVTISTAPVNTTDATNKTYVDSLGYLTAGTGLTKAGSTLSVNASQTQITSVGTLTSLSVSGATTLTAGTASTTTSTGTLVVSGGIGVSGQVTATTLAGTIQTASQVNITSLGTLTGLTVSGLTSFTNTTEATATNTASVTIAGGLGVAKRLFVGGDVVYPSACKIISNTVDESDTGSLMLSGGGDAIAQRGGYIQMYGQQHATNAGQLILGSTTVTGSIIMQTAGINRVTVNLAGDMSVLNTTTSTSTSTGALIVTGGLGVGGTINAVTVSATSGITGTLQTASQPNITSVGTLSSLNVSGATQMGGVVTITNTTDSTSTTTGALVVSGGMAVAKTLVMGAGVNYKTRLISANTTLAYTDNSVAVNTSTGAVTVTLPSAANGTEGFEIKIGKVTSDTNSLIVAPQTGESIGGAITGSWTLTSLYASIQLISIGDGKWGIIAIQDPLNSNLSSSSSSSSSLGDPIWSNSATGAIDGTVTISTNTSLTRDMYYVNLTINSGITLTSNGWRIFVYGTLTLNGKISNDGGNASGTTAGIAPLTNHLGGGTNGGAGRTGSGNGSNGVSSPTANFLGGRGGQTYNTSSGRNGGNAGVITYLQESDGGPNVMASFPYSLLGRCTGNGSTGLCGGTGGAGGALERGITTTGRSGGGGAGAGTVIVAARTISGSGSITANGGNGSDAAYTGSLGVTAALGGGGGGGGGVVSVFYRFNTSSVTFTANGGTGGTSFGNVSNGQAGESGLVYVTQV